MVEDIESAVDLPHTLTYAIGYRIRLNSFNELPKDKKPPRNLWDKPYRLSRYLDTIWDDKKDKETSKNYYEFDLEEVE